MKRLVSFSVATMLAMGMTAGAVSPKPAPQVGNTCKASTQQTANAELAFRQLCAQYGLTADKQKAMCGRFQLSAKPNTDCNILNTDTNKPGANEGTKPDKPVIDKTPDTTPDKPATDKTPDTTPDKPSTDKTPDTTPDKPSTDKTPDITPDKPSTDKTPDTTPDKPSTDKTPDTTPDKPVIDDAPVSQSAFAAQVVNLVNAERAKQGLSALRVDSRVTAAAQTRAGETKSSFSHTRPDGRAFSTALSEAGASYRGAGENIAYGQTTPEAVMNAWMNSAGHRANILNGQYTTIGVGYTVIGGVAYWTQLFTY